MKSFFSTYRMFFLFLIAFCISFSILFFQLGVNALENWDEAWYAEMTKQMLINGNPFVLYWNKMSLLDKPPLLIWLNSVVVLVSGYSEISFRFVSALSALTTVSLVSVYSYKKWGFIAAIFVYFSLLFNSLFIWRGRSGNIDSLLTLLFVCAFLLIVSRIKQRIRLGLLGLVFSLIFLTKLTIVLLPLAIFLLHELFFYRRKVFSHLLDYGLFLIMFTLPAGLWLLGGYFYEGWGFVRYYLFGADQGVLQLGIEQFKLNYWYHAYYALQRRLFWLFLIGSGFLLLQIRKRENFLLILFSFALLLQLTFTKRDNNWYLLPSMPFWSLTIGYAVFRIQEIWKNYFPKGVLFGQLLLLLFISLISYRTFLTNISPLITARTSNDTVESSRFIKYAAQSDEVVIRLDAAYPQSIFYSDVKILSVSYEGGETNGLFINGKELERRLKSHEVHFFYGEKSGAEKFLARYSEFQFEKVFENKSEVVLYFR